MSRAQLKHMLMDVGFFDKPKIKALKYDHKYVGVLFYINILCDMSRATDGEIYISCIKAIGENYGYDSQMVEALVSYLHEHGLLTLSKKSGYYSNSRVVEDQEKLAKNQDKWRTKQRQRRDKIETNGIPVKTELLNTEILNIEELKKGKLKILDFVYMDEIEIDTWKVKLGATGFERACEKLNGWIGESKGTIDFNKRLAKGANAAFTIQNWVSQSVSNEGARPGAPQKSSKTASEIWAEMEQKKD
jgi:hypothetical protein